MLLFTACHTLTPDPSPTLSAAEWMFSVPVTDLCSLVVRGEAGRPSSGCRCVLVIKPTRRYSFILWEKHPLASTCQWTGHWADSVRWADRCLLLVDIRAFGWEAATVWGWYSGVLIATERWPLQKHHLASRALRCLDRICITSADIFLIYRVIGLSVENPYRSFTRLNDCSSNWHCITPWHLHCLSFYTVCDRTEFVAQHTLWKHCQVSCNDEHFSKPYV